MIKNMGTIIILDEEKILREGKYKLDELYSYLDTTAKNAHLIRLDKNHYACRGDRQDLFCLDDFTSNVIKNESITKNTKEWYWLENGKLDSNIIEEASEEGIGIWQ